MNHVLFTLIAMSVAGTLVICALLLIDAVALRKGPKRFLYYAWILALVQLLTPVGITTQEVEMPSILDESTLTPVTAQQPTNETVSLLASSQQGADSQTQILSTTSIPDETTQPVQVTPAAFFRWLAVNPWCIWLTGAVLMLLIKILRYRTFARGIRIGAIPCDDIALLDHVALLAEKMRISRPVELCVNPAVASPMLLGIFRPVIVLPSVDMPEEDLDYILLHELSHLRRWDTLYKWAVQIAVCVHWFNPMAYVMSRHINRCCELACDEDVLGQNGSNAYEYGTTLLRAMWMGGPLTGSAGAIELGENKSLLKERVEIMAKNKKSIGTTIVSAFLVGCLLLCTSCVRIVVPVRGNGRDTAEHETIVEPTQKATKAGSVLDLQVFEAAVIVELTDDTEVTASYSTRYNDVDISEQGNTTHVTCTGIHWTGKLRTDQFIKLTVPATAFDTIRLNVQDGFMGWYELPDAAITADMNSFVGVLTLPESFKGSLDVTALDGALFLSSQDAYANCDVTVENVDGFMTGPSAFSRTGNTATYTDGRDGIVNVKSLNGFMAISDSDGLTASILAAAEKGIDDIQSSIQDIVGELPAQQPSPDSTNWANFGSVGSVDIDVDDPDFAKCVEDWATNLASNVLSSVEQAVIEKIDVVSTKLSGIEDKVFG